MVGEKTSNTGGGSRCRDVLGETLTTEGKKRDMGGTIGAFELGWEKKNRGLILKQNPKGKAKIQEVKIPV